MPCNYNEYPPNWFTEIRPAVLERAKNKCENCGILNYQVRRTLPNGDIECHNYFSNQNYKNANEIKTMLNTVEYDGKGLWSVVVLTVAHLDHDKGNMDIRLDRLKAWCQKCHLSYDLPRHVANRKYGRNHRKLNYKLDL